MKLCVCVLFTLSFPSNMNMDGNELSDSYLLWLMVICKLLIVSAAETPLSLFENLILFLLAGKIAVAQKRRMHFNSNGNS